MKTLIYKFIAILFIVDFMASCGKAQLNKFFEKTADQKLVYAALKGDAQKVDEILKRRDTSIDCRGNNGTTPLLFAVMFENKDAVTLLLKQGANPNLQDAGGYSPMSFSARLKDQWFMETILKNGGDVNLRNDLKETPIFQAINVVSIPNLDYLIRAGADINVQNEVGETPMIYAANLNRYDIVNFLLKNGADPKIENNWHYTICFPIQNNGINPSSPLAKERDKVIAWLKEHNAWRIEEKKKKAMNDVRKGVSPCLLH